MANSGVMIFALALAALSAPLVARADAGALCGCLAPCGGDALFKKARYKFRKTLLMPPAQVRETQMCVWGV